MYREQTGTGSRQALIVIILKLFDIFVIFMPFFPSTTYSK
jgi:hypothetical protein